MKPVPGQRITGVLPHGNIYTVPKPSTRPAKPDTGPKLEPLSYHQRTKPLTPLQQRQLYPSQHMGATPAQVAATHRVTYAGSHASLIPGHENLVAAANALLGPNITGAIGGGHFNPWLIPLEGAGLFPGVGKVLRVPEGLFEGGKVLKAGEGVGSAAKTGADVVKRGSLNPAPRVIRVGDKTFVGPASRPRGYRAGQRALDRAAQARIDRGALPQIGLAESRLASSRVHGLSEDARFYGNETERAIAKTLQAAKLSQPQRYALEMVAHETTPAQWIANNHRVITEGASPGTAKRLLKENTLVQSAAQYVREVPVAQAPEGFATRKTAGTTVVLNPASTAAPKLHAVWGDLVHVSGQRAAMARELGLLAPEAELARLSAPGRFRLGARWQDEFAPVTKDTHIGATVKVDGRYPAKLLGVKGNQADVLMLRRGQARNFRKTVSLDSVQEVTGGSLKGAEHFNGGRVYIPSVSVAKRFYQGEARFQSEILPRVVKGGSEFKHPYTAALAEAGLEVHNPAQLVGNVGLEMQRLYSASRELGGLRGVALPHDVVSDARGAVNLGRQRAVLDQRGWQAIRLGKSPLSQEARRAWVELTGKIERGVQLTPDEHRSLGSLVNDLLPTETEIAKLPPEEIGFVPKAMVGSLADRGDPTSGFARAIGSLSRAAKLAIVYTKPGHVPPRLISNTMMVGVQQGFDLFPTSIATFKLWQYDPQLMRYVDSFMGHRGAYESLVSEGSTKAMEKASHALIGPIAWAADKAPRRVALVYEAAQEAGQHLTVPEMAAYLHRLMAAAPGSEDALRWRMIVQRARVAAGEYGRVNAIERRIMPFVFLYQWGKVATKWSARAAVEHPGKAALVGAGIAENERLNRHYGRHRSIWNTFSTPIGRDANGNPTAINWTTSVPFTTPFEYARQAATVFGHGASPLGESPLSALHPGISTLLELATGRNPETGGAIKGNRILGTLEQFGKQTPPGALIAGKHSRGERAGKFFFSNLFPQTDLTTGGSSPAGGTTGSPSRGTITPRQHAQILQLMKQARSPARQAQIRKQILELERRARNRR
jgi:hypothetical protein